MVQPIYAGEPAGTGHPGVYGGDCFVARLDPQGRHFQFVTYFGGSKQERAVYGMALDKKGNIIIASACRSQDLPTTEAAYQRRYCGGEADVMLAKLAPDGTKFTFCTLLGGSGGDYFVMPTADADGNICIVGQTDSPDFPVTPDALQKTYGGGKSDAVLAIFSSDGAKLLYATYLGGSGDDLIRSATLGENGVVYLAGNSDSDDFPLSAHAAQAARKGNHDGVIIKLEPTR